MSRTGIVIQARMGSTRLCGKALADVVGKPLLVRQIERLRLVSDVDRLIVATSDSALDDAIEVVVRSLEGVELWRGPEQDVLARFAGGPRGPAFQEVDAGADMRGAGRAWRP